MRTYRPLTSQEIEAALLQVSEWTVVERTPPGSAHAHQELHRIFNFASFQDAMHFLSTASRFIQMTDHHPSWTNSYATVEVWITTGYLQHRLSEHDFALARYLENLFRQYGDSK